MPRFLIFTRKPSQLLSKALSNIISNAVSHTPQGGIVRIYFERENKAGQSLIDKADKLVIENTCTPLTPEEIKSAFEPFGSGSGSSGHGLGLYLTQRILKVCNIPFEFIAFDKGMRFIIMVR